MPTVPPELLYERGKRFRCAEHDATSLWFIRVRGKERGTPRAQGTFSISVDMGVGNAGTHTISEEFYAANVEPSMLAIIDKSLDLGAPIPI